MKYQDFRNSIKEPYFSSQDIKLLGLKVFPCQLSLWQKKKYIVKLRNGWYALADRLGEITPEEIAVRLYAPSYISLEKALSYYGFIPEMVYAATCLTPRGTRRLENVLGRFIYRHIKPELFFGYKEMGKTLMALPEKALLDYLYFKAREIKDGDALLAARFNYALIRKTIDHKLLAEYAGIFDNKKVSALVARLLRR